MIDIQNGVATRSRPEFPRRDFLRVGALGLGGLTLANWLNLKAQGAVAAGKAKSVIQIYSIGGPSHIDLFDPKPDAGRDYTGPFNKTVKTNVPGIVFNATIPLLAKKADKFTVIRTMTHDTNTHPRGQPLMLSLAPGDMDFPSLGCMVAAKRAEAGHQELLPPFVTLSQDLRISPKFLPKKFGAASPESMASLPGMTPERQDGRRTFLASVDDLARDMDTKGIWETLDSSQQKAYSVMLGDAKKAFDLSLEKPEVLKRYEKSTEKLLLAIRLVEHGVPFVTVAGGFPGDAHNRIFDQWALRWPLWDAGLSAFFEDIASRGLLESTIVTWYGEFGRAPKVDWQPPYLGGRGHWCWCFSALVAGGGFKGGAVVGESDEHGAYPKDRPVYPWDLGASMYQLLGFDPASTVPNPQAGRPTPVSPLFASDGTTVNSGGEWSKVRDKSGKLFSGGILKEIM